MSPLCFSQLMTKMEEEEASPPHLYRWLPQVTQALFAQCLCVVLCSHRRFGLAPSVTVFTESLPSDSAENVTSQSVPMVTASTGMAPAADERDEVFVDQEEEEG